MAISIRCQECGRSFRAPDGLAGKRVKCPRCSAVIDVGGQPPRPAEEAASGGDSPGAIPVTCACGKAFRAKAALAGKRVKCPACGQALEIPKPAPAIADPHLAADTSPTAGMDFDALLAADGAALPDAPLGPPRRPRKRGSGLPTRLIVGLGIGGGVAVLLLVGLMLLWPGGDDAELAGGVATPGAQTPDSPSPTTSPATPPVSPPPPPPAANVAGGERTYPSLPGALTEPPEWLGSDVPFDVEEFFAAPPPERNAAPLYLDALLEFSDEMAACFCPVGEEPQGEIRRRAEAAAARTAKRVQFDEAWQKDWSTVDFAEVDAWLAGYKTGFEKLALAQQRPECVFAINMDSTARPYHGLAAREVTSVVLWRARSALSNGDFDQIRRDLETTLRLCRDIQPRGQMFVQVVSSDMEDYCYLGVVRLFVHVKGIRASHLDHLLAILRDHDAKSRDRFFTRFQGQYLCTRMLLHNLQHRTGDLDPQFLTDSVPRLAVDSPLACLKEIVPLDSPTTWRLSQEKYGRGGVRLPLDHPLVAGWKENGKLLTEDAYGKEVDAMNRVYAAFFGAANQTPLEQLHLSQDPSVVAPLRDTQVALFLEPPWHDFPNTLIRVETDLRGTMCQVAVRRWQLEHDGPPPDLETAVKAAGMAEVPIDPYCDRPMRMTVIEGRPVVYSVGLDGKDDRGLVEWDFNPADPHGDVLFPLPAAQ